MKFFQFTNGTRGRFSCPTACKAAKSIWQGMGRENRPCVPVPVSHGRSGYLDYDLIIGKVANDKVFRVVDMYHSGIWNRERALLEIRAYPNYDQLAFITQRAIDRLLRFEGHLEV